MCNYSDYVERKATEKGLRKGMEQGLRQGMEQGLQQGMERGIKEGIKEGVELGRAETARNLLALGMKIDQIAEVTSLSVQRIEELRCTECV